MALCGLDADEVAAIAEHEHVPQIEAAALARTLLARAGGEEKLRDMIVDDIRQSLRAGNLNHATDLLSALRHYLKDHPHAEIGACE